MDIVERLRRFIGVPPNAIAREAADEIERLRADLALARTLVVSAQLHMPTWPADEGTARASWVRAANRWLERNSLSA